MALAGTNSEGDSIVFAGWQEVLATSSLAAAVRAAHEREIGRQVAPDGSAELHEFLLQFCSNESRSNSWLEDILSP